MRPLQYLRRLTQLTPPPAPAPEPQLPQQALSASVATVQLDGVGWQTWRPGGHAWQDEGWRLYDITGQLRFVSNWIGQSVSRCRLYVAEVDDSGEAAAEVTDPDIAQLAAGPLGVGPAKDEALRLLGINLFVPGEAYIIAESAAGDHGEDRWFVVSGRQMRRAGDRIIIRRPLLHGGGDMAFRPNIDLILRVWTPHPAETDQPDSPTRSAIPDLRMIEAIRKREFAELDSRLAGAGILPLPEGVDFPRGPDDDQAGLQSFTDRLGQTMSRSMADRSSAEAMVPIMFTVPIEALGKIGPVTFWSPLSAELIPLHTATVISLAQSLDVPPEILLGSGDQNHWCTVHNVEIMTRAGWKTYGQLTVGEEVLTLNHGTGLSEWQPLLAVNTWDVVDEPMVAIKGRGHSSLTTSRHRWPILAGGRWKATERAWTTSGELAEQARAVGNPDGQTHDYLVLAAPNADLPTEAKYADALVEMVAWYFTEGSLGVRAGRRTPQVTIYQSHHVNPDNCARIARALTTLFGPASESLDKGGRYATAESVERRAAARQMRADNPAMSALEIGRRLGVSGPMVGKYLAQDARLRDAVPRWRSAARGATGMTEFILNAAAAEGILGHAPARVVTLDFIRDLTASQLDLFIDTAVRADGYVQGSTIKFGQKDPRMCDAIELAAVLAGRYVNRYTVAGIGRSATGPREKTLHYITIGSRTTFAPRGRSFTEETYTGTIWCPTTPNGSWLARHEGTVFYTGNSAWQTSEEAITTQIMPVLSRIADALTTGYLRVVLEEMGYDPDRYTYAFDVGPLVVRPNRSADALSYHGAVLISDEAAVKAGAFGDDDMPSPEERIRRILETAAAATPELLSDPVVWKLLGMSGPPPAGLAPPPPPAPVMIAPGPAVEPPTPNGPPAQPGEKNPTPEPPTAPPAAPPATTAALDHINAVIAVSGQATRRALAYAGARLVSHGQRAQLTDLARHQLHTHHGPISAEQADLVLRGAWDDLPVVADELHLDPGPLEQLLHGFAVELLTRGMAYDQVLLRDLVLAAMRGRRLDETLAVAA